MIYLWSFILSCLCCRTIYRGVAVLVSIIKNAVLDPFRTIHIVQERKKREEKSQRQAREITIIYKKKKKKKKDRYLFKKERCLFSQEKSYNSMN